MFCRTPHLAPGAPTQIPPDFKGLCVINVSPLSPTKPLTTDSWGRRPSTARSLWSLRIPVKETQRPQVETQSCLYRSVRWQCFQTSDQSSESTATRSGWGVGNRCGLGPDGAGRICSFLTVITRKGFSTQLTMVHGAGFGLSSRMLLHRAGGMRSLGNYCPPKNTLIR